MSEKAIDIGSRRQLLVDRRLIDKMDGVRLELHHPQPRETVIAPEYPWERHGVSYMTIVRDGGMFRAWYRCDGADNVADADRQIVTAYAESDDGNRWHKPMLGLVEFAGSKENNIISDGWSGNFAAFLDENPSVSPTERFKAIVSWDDVYGMASPDGLRWRLISHEPLLTDRPFDSLNIAFWDAATGLYVAYTRGVRYEGPLGQGMESRVYWDAEKGGYSSYKRDEDRFKGGVRWVRRATSPDFLHWSPLEPIRTGDTPREEFYTNSTTRYERAPDYLMMFPSRFASGREPQPDWPFGKGVNDIPLLTSQDGLNWDRTFMEAFIRPGLDQGNWHERAFYMERGIMQTSPAELSLYCMENFRLPGNNIRRYTLRLDGFASARAPYLTGELLSNPLVFSGGELRLNFSTSAVGWMKVELLDAACRPLPGFTLAECPDIYGDKVDAKARWNSGNTPAKLAGKTVRLRFMMSDADLYAFRFNGDLAGTA